MYYFHWLNNFITGEKIIKCIIINLKFRTPSLMISLVLTIVCRKLQDSMNIEGYKAFRGNS